MKKNKNSNVLVALSGGVDSAVAAALLLKQGYEVTGAFMIQYSDTSALQHNNTAAQCWINDYRDALRVAAHLGIPLLKFDFSKQYKKDVLNYMFAQYKAGRTPNPDVLCNTYIKFGVWLKKAKESGFSYLATGHYTHLMKTFQHNNTSTHLMQAKDKDKDQTYFLHQLNQEQLSHVLFPIGDYTKPQVRRLAKKFGLPNAEREESMGICFIGEVPMKKFVKNEIKTKSGNIVLSSGGVIGKHEGLSLYTIGQRHIGVLSSQFPVPSNTTRPLYVVDKRLDTNELVVGFEDDPLLYKKEITIGDLHWVSGQEPTFPLQCQVRLRHRQPLQFSVLSSQSSAIRIQFSKPQRAVTPGQFAVFYKNKECLGGGVIE